MRATGSLWVLALWATACTVELATPPGVQSSCARPTDCPGGLVCLADEGRCESLDNPCIQAEGDHYISSPFGTLCARSDGGGICSAGVCEVSQCGDGFVDEEILGEGCDDGSANSDLAPDACRLDCQPARCGDGVTDPLRDEDCDDGAANAEGAACSVECTRGCGDGFVQAGEICDDANIASGDDCDANCTPTGCGNAVRTPGEGCDDGDLLAGDGCDPNCEPTGCGNGWVTDDEECDDGNFVDGVAGSAPGVDHCDHDCTVSRCGNGIISLAAGEQCDDGNDLAGDGCSAACTMERGFVCGNIPSDCVTVCGDGLIAGGETCDDRNTANEDGCDQGCHVEPGFGCRGEASECVPTWYVDGSRGSPGDGLSWATAFNTLQAALIAANSGVGTVPLQDIWVAEGTYRPAGPGGSREATFRSLHDTRWYGGFAGDETRFEQRNFVDRKTTLSGDLNDDDAAAFANRTDNVCHVVTVDRATPTSPLNTAQTLDGFTIEGGQADASSGASCTVTLGPTIPVGGGILMSGRAVLRNLIVRDNQVMGATGGGGGLYAVSRNTPIRIYDSRFEGNRAAYAGGVLIASSSTTSDFDPVLVVRSVFDGNSATDSGGGLLAHSFVILASTFENNQALSGGAIFVFANAGVVGEPVLLNVLIRNNTATSGSSALFGDANTSHLVHCLHCTILGDSVYLSNNSIDATFRNSILDGVAFTLLGGATASADYSFVDADSPSGVGNVGDDGDDANLDGFGVPNGGSMVLDVASSVLPTITVPDLCDIDRDGDRKAQRDYDFGKDPCDLDGDGNIIESLPVDRAGNPRRTDQPGVGGSGVNSTDMGAFER